MRGPPVHADVRLLLVLVALLAGCATPQAAPPAAAPEAQALPVHDAELPGAGGTEPSLALSADGRTLFVAAPDFPGNAPAANHVWRSDDAGATWKPLGPVAQRFGTNDADVLARQDGSLVVATPYGGNGIGYEQCVAISTSTDGGATFQESPLGCAAPGAHAYDRPWLAEDGGTLYDLVYEGQPGVCLPEVGCGLPVGGTRIGLLSTTDGATWRDQTVRASASTFCLPGSLAVPRPGELAFACALLHPGSPATWSGPLVSRSADGGATWRDETVSEGEVASGHLRLAMDGDSGYVAWIARRPDGSTHALASRLAGGRWSAPESLTANGTDLLPAAAMAGGHVLVAWIHADEQAPPAKLSTNATWRLVGVLDGKPFDAGVVRVGPGCTSLEACPPKGRSMGDFLSARVLPDGRGAIAYAKPLDKDRDQARLHVAVVG